MKPHLSRPSIDIYCGDVREILPQLPAESVHCVVTSPPYWGLRDYGTSSWEGGDPACDHFRVPLASEKSTLQGYTGPSVKLANSGIPYKGHCGKCGALRTDSQIGLEDSPDKYIATMVEVFRCVWRVLRKDGTLWLNMGDSYFSNNKGTGGSDPAKSSISAWKGLDNAQAFEPKNFSPGAFAVKPKDLVGIPWRLAFALQADGWYLRSDIIWCLSGGTRLYAKTQKGVMPATVHDLVRLNPSTVKLWNGEKWTQVLGWSQTPHTEAIEIELRSGEKLACTPGHQWPTKRGLVRADNLVLGDVIDSCKLPDEDLSQAWKLKESNVAYVCGVYLAEGSKSGETLQFSLNVDEKEIAQRIASFAAAYGGSCHWHEYGKNLHVCVEGRVPMAVIDTYITGSGAEKKHLTNACWQHGNSFLEALLEGYLDGDAHFERENKRWRLGFTRNYYLAADLRTLAARLGYQIRLRLDFATIGETRYETYRGELRKSVSDHGNCKPNTEIVRIGRSNGRSFWDIGIEDEPHLFSLASGVLTHNSKPNPMPESVGDRPTKAHEYIFLLAKSETYYYDADAIRTEFSEETKLLSFESMDFAKRSRYKSPDGWDTSKGNGGHGSIHKEGREKGRRFEQRFERRDDAAAWSDLSRAEQCGGANKRTVWEVSSQAFPEAHFATFPEELIRPCILAGTSEFGCCHKCGAPWQRVIKKEFVPQPDVKDPDKLAKASNKGMDESNGWAEYPRGTQKSHTTGWEPTCECYGWSCRKCRTVIDTQVHEEPRTMQRVQEAVSPVQEDLLGTAQNEQVLFAGMRGDLAGQAPQDHNGQVYDNQRLRDAASSGASACNERRLRDGTSRGDGKNTRKVSKIERDSPPPEQAKSRQSRREFGSDAEDGPRPSAKAETNTNTGMSTLRSDSVPSRVCGRCGSALEYERPDLVRPVVLDPFMGSGTTALVARANGCKSIGVELNEKYIGIAERRLSQDVLPFSSSEDATKLPAG